TAMVNVALNYVLVPVWGIYGIIATSIISYGTLIAYRWVDTRRYCRLRLYPATLIPLGIMVVCGLVFNHITPVWANAALMVVLLAAIAASAPAFLKSQAMQKINSAVSRVMQKDS
ncbi:MAG: polysaccharide biosynthesis C-terminal domain-containing protein, partial [Bacteroidales bacterium]|nr:polysaccharide biosynthesis C-terminal domain-containing protein [Bacteroidales bacterium]